MEKEINIVALEFPENVRTRADDVSSGLNGVGIACTNALLESFVVFSRIM